MYDRTILSTIEYHHSMLTDEVRMRSYLQAVLKAVKPGDVVLDIGSGTGILTYIACMAGARRVYAIEQDPLVGLAETISRHNGFDDRIVFVNDWSDHVELPELADVLLTETIDNMGFEEGILGWIIDARDRLLDGNGRIVPQSVELVVVPTAAPGGFNFLTDWQEETYTLDLTPIHEVVANNLLWGNLSPKAFLSEPAAVARTELATVTSSDICGEGRFQANRNGEVHGLGCWFRSTLIPDITISNGPPFDTPSWTQIFLPLQRPLSVSAADCLHVQIQSDGNGANWHWQISNGHDERGSYNQSTLSGQLLKPLSHGDSKRKPIRTVEGEIYWTDGGQLPPSSIVTVQIVNASLADATDVLTESSFEAEGSPPIEFFMEYAESVLDERMTYNANVRIEDADGTLLYITKTAQPVIVQGEVVDPIRILVEPV